MADLKYIGKNILNHDLILKKGDISGSSSSTGSFGRIDVADNISADSFTGTFDGALSSSAQISSQISGSLGPNATLIRGLTAARITGSSNILSSSLATRVTNLKSDSGSFSTRITNFSTGNFELISGSATSTGSFGSVMQNGKHFPQTNAPGENIAFGTDAGSAFVGGNVNKINIAIGSSAGTAMADYGGNVFIGKNAAKLRTRGDDNVAIGTSAGGTDGDDFGDKNVFIGLSTGLAINSTNSDANVFIGSLAGTAGQQSIANVLIGSDAGKTLTDSSRNVAIGAFAGTGFGVTNTTTENSIYIGQYARTSVTNANNEIVIGSEAVGHGTDTITFGDNQITDVYFASGSSTGATFHGVKQFSGNISGSSTSTGSFGHLNISGPGDNVANFQAGNRTLSLKLNDSAPSGDVGVQFRAGSGDYLGLAAGGGTSHGIVIHSNSDVAIGHDNPTVKLDVAGAIKASGDITANGNIVGDNATNISAVNDITALGNISGSATSTGSFGAIRSIGLPLFVDSDHVGIGTTNAASYYNSPLVTYAPSVNYLTIATNTNGISSILMADGTSGAQAYAAQLEYQHATDEWRFHGGGSRFMTVINSNVGIGDENPSEKLSVTGNIKTSGNITGSGNLEIAGNMSGSAVSTGSFGNLRVAGLTVPDIKVLSSSISDNLGSLSASSAARDTLSETTSSKILNGELEFTNITGSGHISMSLSSTASFGRLEATTVGGHSPLTIDAATTFTNDISSSVGTKLHLRGKLLIDTGSIEGDLHVRTNTDLMRIGKSTNGLVISGSDEVSRFATGSDGSIIDIGFTVKDEQGNLTLTGDGDGIHVDGNNYWYNNTFYRVGSRHHSLEYDTVNLKYKGQVFAQTGSIDGELFITTGVSGSMFIGKYTGGLPTSGSGTISRFATGSDGSIIDLGFTTTDEDGNSILLTTGDGIHLDSNNYWYTTGHFKLGGVNNFINWDTNNLTISGTFTGDGSGITGLAADTPSGTVSSSAQLASAISGSFTSVSASLAARISASAGSSGGSTPAGTVSSSAQLATSISGSFTGVSASLSTRISSSDASLTTVSASLAARIAVEEAEGGDSGFSSAGISGSWKGVIGSGSLNNISGSAISTGSFGKIIVDDVLSIRGFTNVSTSLAAAVAGGDNLGNHTATQDINLNGFSLKGINNITASGHISGSATSTGSFGRVETTDDMNVGDDLTVNGLITSNERLDIQASNAKISIGPNAAAQNIHGGFLYHDSSISGTSLGNVSGIGLTTSGTAGTYYMLQAASGVGMLMRVSNAGVIDFPSATKISGSATSTGSFGKLFGDGSEITNVTATAPTGTVSGSAQLSTAISGSFTSTSASFSTRLTTRESYLTQSFSDGTAALISGSATSTGSFGVVNTSGKITSAGGVTVTGTSKLQAFRTSGQYIEMYSDGNGSNYLQAQGNIRFAPNLGTKMILHTNGRLGLNTTTDAGFLLDINGTSRLTGDVTLGADISGSADSTGSFGHIIGDGSEITNVSATLPSNIVSQSAGNISASSLQLGGRLELQNNQSIFARKSGGVLSNVLTLDNNNDVILSGPLNESLYLNSNPNSATEGILFSTDGGSSTEMILADGGNLGIGTATPSQKLTVSGNIFATGNISGSADSTGSLGVIQTPLEGRVISNFTEMIKVTVVSDGGNHYAFEGATAPSIQVSEGKTYRFDISDSTVGTHPFRFSTTQDGQHNGGSAYTTGVTIVGTQGQAGAYVELQVTKATVNHLYYYCTAHGGMGNDGKIMKNDLTNLHMISGSAVSSGSLGSLKITGASVDFTNLPTSDPGVAGRLWNDSNALKISAG